MQCVHKHLLLTLGKKAQTGVLHYSEPKRVIHRCCGLFLFCRGHQLSGWCFSVALDTLAFTLLTECGHKSPWQPPNVVWAFSIYLVCMHKYIQSCPPVIGWLSPGFGQALNLLQVEFTILFSCLCSVRLLLMPFSDANSANEVFQLDMHE